MERNSTWKRFAVLGLASSIGALLRRLHNWNCPSFNSRRGWGLGRIPSTIRVGIYGEVVAASWMAHHGYSILRRNWKFLGAGEIDLVCRDGDELVFAEVKTRRKVSDIYGTPARAVDRKKRELLRKGSRQWLAMLGGTPVSYRYDVVEVILPQGERPSVNVIKSAFGIREGK